MARFFRVALPHSRNRSPGAGDRALLFLPNVAEFVPVAFRPRVGVFIRAEIARWGRGVKNSGQRFE